MFGTKNALSHLQASPVQLLGLSQSTQSPQADGQAVETSQRVSVLGTKSPLRIFQRCAQERLGFGQLSPALQGLAQAFLRFSLDLRSLRIGLAHSEDVDQSGWAFDTPSAPSTRRTTQQRFGCPGSFKGLSARLMPGSFPAACISGVARSETS